MKTLKQIQKFMQKMRTLKQVQKYLDDIPNINSGGCGVSALAMKKWLKKNKNKDVKIKFLYRGHEFAYMKNDEILKGNEKENLRAPAHCCIIYGKKHKDSTGDILLRDFSTRHEIPNDKMFIDCVKDDSTWNPCFERDMYIPKIEKDLGISLKEVK
ncbi:MAG: hypothetical protein R6U15_06550 [Candidatus Izemoplasmatales bacterium]